ncbi:MAG: DUF2155 domain-containing protein [Alphaproteobacteria bacterium]|nr:DUF2155 domain-containing protein [Alphaproteobacteria bacterium]
MNKSLVFFAILAVHIPASAEAIVPTQEKPSAIVRVLDKMTARVEEIELKVGTAVNFGSISIVARSCKTTLPEESPPESATFLEVSDIRVGATEAGIFKGWMFTSSPALSAMEHPVYDIWVTGCKE